MKQNVIRKTLFTLAAVAWLVSIIPGLAYSQSLSVLTGLHPRPQTSFLRTNDSAFRLDASTVIVVSDSVNASTRKAVQFLERTIRQEIGDTLPVLPISACPFAGTPRTITIGELSNFPELAKMLSSVTLNGEILNKPEGYTLDVSKYGILMGGFDSSGTFYSVSTLAQLLNETRDTIPSLHIFDFPDYPVRWVFSTHNLQVIQQVRDLEAIEDTMAAHKLNGLMQADFKYGVLDIVAPWYFTDVDTLHAHSYLTNTEIIPAVFSGSGILWHDPDLAEGFPTTCLYRIEGDSGRLLSDPRMQLPNGGFENISNGQFTGWGFYDNPNQGIFIDSTQVHAGRYSARCTNFTDSTPRARFIEGLTCDTNTSYHMSVWIRTEGFQQGYEGSFQLLAIGYDDSGNSRGLTATNYDVPATSNGWLKYDVLFNTLHYTKVYVYVGVWDGTAGTIWFDDFQIEDAGLTNILRRPTTTPVVTLLNGNKQYKEGGDYQRLVDTIMEQSNGSYPWHPSPSFILAAGSTMRVGDSVRVRFDRTLTVLNYENGDGYQFPCLSEDTLYSIFHDQIQRVDALHNPHQYFLSHDELRVMDWDSACVSRHLTAAQILADNLTKCDSIIKVIHPGAQTYVWSDMFDSLHNAHNNYYLVNGDLSGDWDLIPKNITIANWNGNMRPSLDFFASHGFSQITSPYYDVQNTDNMRAWRIAMEGVPNVKGMMYTTWSADYSFLTPFADYAWSAGPMIVSQPLQRILYCSGDTIQLNADIFVDSYLPTDSIIRALAIVSKYNGYDTVLMKQNSANYYSASYRLASSGANTYQVVAFDGEGLVRMTPNYQIDVAICDSFDVATRTQVSDLRLFPNPASNALTILRNSATRTSIFLEDLLGREVARFETSSESSILDIHNIPAGIYECIITDSSGKREIQQFVKE